MREPPSDKFKESQKIHSLQTFRNRRPVLSEILSRMQPRRICLPMFWTKANFKNFYKIIKVPVALLRRVNIQIIFYLDDMLLMGKTLPETIMARDTLIFLLQNLGFGINLKKSVLHPAKKIKSLGLVIDTGKMTLAFQRKN